MQPANNTVLLKVCVLAAGDDALCGQERRGRQEELRSVQWSERRPGATAVRRQARVDLQAGPRCCIITRLLFINATSQTQLFLL